MTASRVLGFTLIALAVVYLIIALIDIGPEYSAVPSIVEHQEDLGLVTSTTNLRFKIGLEFVVDLVIILLLVLVGWWLTTSEIQQWSYLWGFGVLIAASIVIRVTPLIPLTTANISPGALFFGAKVVGSATADETDQWVVIPQHKNLRVATVAAPGQQQGGLKVILDFGRRNDLLQQYLGSYPPVPIKGMALGTHYIAKGKDLDALMSIRVDYVGTRGQSEAGAAATNSPAP